MDNCTLVGNGKEIIVVTVGTADCPASLEDLQASTEALERVTKENSKFCFLVVPVSIRISEKSIEKIKDEARMLSVLKNEDISYVDLLRNMIDNHHDSSDIMQLRDKLEESLISSMHAVNCHSQPYYRKNANKNKACDSLISGDHDEENICTCGIQKSLEMVRATKEICPILFGKMEMEKEKKLEE